MGRPRFLAVAPGHENRPMRGSPPSPTCGLRPVAQALFSTAWRLSLCPSGEAAFGPCSPPRLGLPFHSVRPPCLPVPRVAGCGPGRPRARARMLLCPRPDRAIRAGIPRGPHEAAAATPRRGSPVRDPRAQERMATRGTGGSTTPPPISRRSCWRTKGLTQSRGNSRISAWRGGGWLKPPSGGRPMAPERAGPERASRGGVSMLPPERSERRETARGPAAGRPARSHAQAGRRPALDAPPERHGHRPRGKTETSRSEEGNHPRGTGERGRLNAEEPNRAGRASLPPDRGAC